MTTRTDELEAAMCLWEAVMEIREQQPQVQAAFERHGTSAMRHVVMSWIPDLAWAWAAIDEYDLTYDWDFVPAWISKNIDWSEV